MNLFIDFLMKKTILQYMTDIYQEDIPKHILQENKIRLNSFSWNRNPYRRKGLSLYSDMHSTPLRNPERSRSSIY